MRYLICFAVPQEARYFVPMPAWGGQITVTGMGGRNAVETVRKLLPSGGGVEVITSGFAGGLDPSLPRGQILWDADSDFSLAKSLASGKARPGSFHCSDRIASRVAEKTALRLQTGAGAVEMESGAIRALCRERGVPSATIRVISDAADDDLPLDFNALMTSKQRMNYAKLAATLVLRPGTIPRLIRFQREIDLAARVLGAFLTDLMRHDDR